MQLWEINDIIQLLPYLDRNLWETSRLNAYVTAQVNSRKTIKQNYQLFVIKKMKMGLSMVILM